MADLDRSKIAAESISRILVRERERLDDAREAHANERARHLDDVAAFNVERERHLREREELVLRTHQVGEREQHLALREKAIADLDAELERRERALAGDSGKALFESLLSRRDEVEKRAHSLMQAEGDLATRAEEISKREEAHRVLCHRLQELAGEYFRAGRG